MTLKRAMLMPIGLTILAWSVSCEEFAPGPTLSVEVPRQSLSLAPTTGNRTLCCCRVLGIAINRSTVPVHVTVKFEAYRTGEEKAIGTAVDFMSAVQPGEERRIDASGLLIPCASIDRFELVDLDMRGVWFPSS